VNHELEIILDKAASFGVNIEETAAFVTLRDANAEWDNLRAQSPAQLTHLQFKKFERDVAPIQERLAAARAKIHEVLHAAEIAFADRLTTDAERTGDQDTIQKAAFHLPITFKSCRSVTERKALSRLHRVQRNLARGHVVVRRPAPRRAEIRALVSRTPRSQRRAAVAASSGDSSGGDDPPGPDPPSQAVDPRDLLTVRHAKRLLSVVHGKRFHRSQIYRLAKRGDLQTVLVAGNGAKRPDHVRITRQSLESFLAKYRRFAHRVDRASVSA
jgi:hypothetical protein